MAMAGDWLCRGVEVCLHHNHPLVPLWTSPRPIDRDDIGARMAELLPDLLAGALDRDPITPSANDLWIDRRLARSEDDTWLATQPLFAAMTFCTLLGENLMRVQQMDAQDRTAKAVGFVAASKGPDAIDAALDRLMRAEDGGYHTTRTPVGSLFETLERLYRDDDRFDGFREILRRKLLRIWPIAAGDMLLGKPVPERRLHSLITASKQTGMGPAVLNDFLTEAGAFGADDKRQNARKTFDAGRFQPLLEEIPTLIGPIEMRKAMGATRAELMSLEAEGILVPRTKVPTIKSPWRLSDGLDLVAELDNLAAPLDIEAKDWETLQLAHRRSELPLAQLISAIRDGMLPVSKHPDVFGYHGFVVDRRDVDQLADQSQDRPDPTPMDGEINATAFARSVGVRHNGAFLALIAGGHTPATEVLNPTTRRQQLRMTDRDIAAFIEKFTTPTLMSKEFGLHRNTILAALSAERITPFQPDGANFGPVYLRAVVDPVLEKRKD